MLRTIRAKFIVGFLLIFSISFLLLNQLILHNIEASNEKIITGDLIRLKNNSSVYVRQAYMIHHYASDQLYFGQMAEEMVEDLRHTADGSVGAYSITGELLFASDRTPFAGADDDLRQALLGKTAYTISYSDGTASVLYSYPVVIDGVKVGILRFATDFSLLYEQSRRILNIIFYTALAIFAAAFLFSYLLSRHITIPLVKLTKASTEVSNGNLEIDVDIRRKDEIGRLASNFGVMIGKIRSQIARIESDRDRLKELNRHRKRFFDNVTHELKTPLTTILGYAEMIRQTGGSDKAFLDKGMNHIVDESRRLHHMVLKLLEMSRESSGTEDFEPVEAGSILLDVCESMTVKAERYGKTIRCEAAADLRLYGDADRLRQLFINLVDNAIKYGDPRSAIIVTGARADADVSRERTQAARIGTNSPAAPDKQAARMDAAPAAWNGRLAGGSIRIAVINEGETIPPEQLARMFEPYYQAARANGDDGGGAEKEGIGLGLGISREIVEAHGGTIRMTSEDGRTSVVIELPGARDVS